MAGGGSTFQLGWERVSRYNSISGRISNGLADGLAMSDMGYLQILLEVRRFVRYGEIEVTVFLKNKIKRT